VNATNHVAPRAEPAANLKSRSTQEPPNRQAQYFTSFHSKQPVISRISPISSTAFQFPWSESFPVKQLRASFVRLATFRPLSEYFLLPRRRTQPRYFTPFRFKSPIVAHLSPISRPHISRRPKQRPRLCSKALFAARKKAGRTLSCASSLSATRNFLPIRHVVC
jgi:hypothetical protein